MERPAQQGFDLPAPADREVMIGLEIHGYLAPANNRKLFCDCAIDPQAAPNTTICPVCTAQPGSKPMLPNQDAIERILAVAALLDCAINTKMLFQRKHYSWPDLPAGYQKTISGSYGIPSAEHGSYYGIRIKEIHLEEDPARWDPDMGTVDYNRSGYPLMELVTEPDFTSSEQVVHWIRALLSALGYVNAIRPELGIKCDVNVSIPPDFIRTEVKNINSVSSIRDAIEYERVRQAREPALQQTRTFDPASGMTVFMRSKEDAADYRFIPEPDLPVVDVAPEMVARIRATVPESPERKHRRYLAQGVAATDARVLSGNLALATLFEEVAKATDATWAAKWFRRDVNSYAAEDEQGFARLVEYHDQVLALFALAFRKGITDQTCKELLERLSQEFIDVEEHVRTKGLAAVADSSMLESAVDAALAQSPAAVDEIRAGKDKAINFIVGKVMANTRGTARPDAVKALVLRKIHDGDGNRRDA